MTRNPNAAWDRQWRVERPADYTPGLFHPHQIDAFHLLRSGCPLTEWEAQFLQIVAYQVGDMASLQRFWLRRIEREQLGEMAA